MSLLDDLHQADVVQAMRSRLASRTKELKKIKQQNSKLKNLLKNADEKINNLEKKLKTKLRKNKPREEVLNTSNEESSDNS